MADQIDTSRKKVEDDVKLILRDSGYNELADRIAALLDERDDLEALAVHLHNKNLKY